MTDPEHITTTRDAYNHSAAEYVAAIGTTISVGIEAPIDRAALAAFVEVVSIDPGTIADIGCGPGRVAAYLTAAGLAVVGTDLCEAMIAHARHAHPDIHFEVGALDNLPYADASLRGAVYWYSIIHTPPDQLAIAFDELLRVLQPNGDVLIAFQAGDGQAVTKHDAYGSGAALTHYRHRVNNVIEHLHACGFEISTTILREATYSHESTPQAFLFAFRSSG